MKNKRFLCIPLAALVFVLLGAMLVFFASADDGETTDVLYEVTLADDTVVSVTEPTDFGGLIKDYPTAKAIKLYADINVNTIGTAKPNKVGRDLDIDLNNHTITSVGAYIYPETSSVHVTVHDGKIVHTSSYFAFVGSGSSVVIENCEITAAQNFVHQRTGNFTLRNSVVTSSANASAGLVQLSYAGVTSDLLIEDVTFENAKMSLVSIARNSSSKVKNVTIKDTVFTSATKSVLYFADDASATSATGAVTNVHITGDTKLSYKSFVGQEGLISTSVKFDEGVKVSAKPSITMGTIGYADAVTGFADNTDSDSSTYPYVTVKSDILYKLTLADGSIVNVGEKKSFYELITDYGEVKAIKLNVDLEINRTPGGVGNYITADLDIDLNGKTITANGGYIRPDLSAKVVLHDGNAVHKSSNFVFMNSSSAEFTIQNCNISATENFIHLRAGSMSVKNSVITSSTDKESSFAQISYVGAVSNLLFDGVTFDNAKMALVSLGRDATSEQKNVTVNDTVFNTTRSVFFFFDQTSDADATASITFTGNTKLSYSELCGTAPMISKTTVAFGEGVMLTDIPSVSNAEIAYLGDADGFLESGDELYPYVATKTTPYYVITLSDGTEKSVYTKSTLGDLMKLTDSGSVIKLYSDVDLPAEITSTYITNKNVEINLNGYTLTNSGARLRAYGDSKITVYGGKVVDSASAQFLFTGGADTDKELEWIFDNCDITANSSFVQLRNGSLTIKNSTITTIGVSTLVAFSTAGSHASLIIENCTVDLDGANLVNLDRSSTTRERFLTVKDSTVTTTSSLLKFGTGVANDGTVIEFEFIGDTKLVYSSLDGKTNQGDDVTVKFGAGVQLSAPPKLSVGKVELSEGADGIVKIDGDVYRYVVSANAPISVEPKFSLTLYTDFTLNLCFEAAYKSDIASVKIGEKVLTPILDGGYYIYPIDGISPLNVAEKQYIELCYYNYGVLLTKTLEYAVTDYVGALLLSGYSVESKELIARATDYIKATFEYVGETLPPAITDIIGGEEYKNIQNTEWVDSVPDSATDVGELYSVIDSARLIIDSGVSFRFYLKSGIGSGTLNVSSLTVNESYTVENSLIGGKNYFDVGMRAFEFFGGSVEISFGDVLGSYDFKAYANSDVVANGGEKLGKLVVAMYNYFREASEYIKVADKDFRPAASVVVKDGKSGTVTYIFDDGDPDTGVYTAQMLRDYENLKITYGLIAEKYATLQTVYNEETGKYEYVFDKNGKYVYTENKTASQLWRDLVQEFNTELDKRIEYTSHTFTHDFPGYNDEGGTVQYVDTSGNIKTVTLPVGSASAEVYATIQVLRELFGEEGLTIVEAGVPAAEGDRVVDGVLYPGYYAYYWDILMKAYEEGLLVGARGGGVGAPSAEYIITSDALSDLETRFNMHAYSLRHTQSIESWKQQIDYATESGGWALMMLHRIYADDTSWDSTVIHTKEWQTRELFEYTDRDDVWVTTLTEATKYYSEWSTSEVTVEMSNGVITVNLTDRENNELYDEALTVKVTVPSGWDSCVANGVELEVNKTDSGEAFVYVDIVPDSGLVEITRK